MLPIDKCTKSGDFAQQFLIKLRTNLITIKNKKNAQWELRILYIRNPLIKNIISLSSIFPNIQPFLFQPEPNVRKAPQLYQED